MSKGIYFRNGCWDGGIEDFKFPSWDLMCFCRHIIIKKDFGELVLRWSCGGPDQPNSSHSYRGPVALPGTRWPPLDEALEASDADESKIWGQNIIDRPPTQLYRTTTPTTPADASHTAGRTTSGHEAIRLPFPFSCGRQRGRCQSDDEPGHATGPEPATVQRCWGQTLERMLWGQ
jgi:hypothetical protein